MPMYMTSFCYGGPHNLIVKDAEVSAVTVAGDKSKGRVVYRVQGFKDGRIARL